MVFCIRGFQHSFVPILHIELFKFLPETNIKYPIFYCTWFLKYHLPPPPNELCTLNKAQVIY